MSFEAKWRLLARVGVRCYILISNVSGAVKVAPLQILQFWGCNDDFVERFTTK